jgi:hypothetical protein
MIYSVNIINFLIFTTEISGDIFRIGVFLTCLSFALVTGDN